MSPKTIISYYISDCTLLLKNIHILFLGIICNEFKAFMPQRIKAFSGSCVLIPCTFTIEERLESAMEPARGIWMTSYNFRDIVFDSSRPYNGNTLKAELLGKVTNKNCTTIIHHLKTSDSKSYFFRAVPAKYTFHQSVTLEVADSPDRPAISPSSAVKEGAPTSLACTAPAPCPREPPTLVWSDTLDGSVEIKQVEQQDGTKAVSSVLTFTPSHLHHNKDITCTVQYPVGSETKSAEEVSTLHVLCMPQISHESSCSKDYTESITCICVSRGSPSPITEWRIAGNKLENNTDRGSISNSKLEDHTMRSTLILLEPLAKNEAIQCLSKNRIGTASFQFHVFHEQKEGIICNEFKAFMPQRIKALSGSCVLIPCTFTIEERLEIKRFHCSLDSPDRPAISPSSAVKEGAPTSLACTAPAPCPREPPALVWSDTLNGSVEIKQVEQQDRTKAVSSVLTFTASHLHHNKDITCTVQYPVGSETKSAEEVLTLHVLCKAIL
ncbi:vascular cell adhesion protein 1-like [Huso huso]|uniref:Vascular cell adhesion protein 1-like n=1 Tax=Huso huso TaxID=61971 RepID=A0ABR0YAM2_HUSHU